MGVLDGVDGVDGKPPKDDVSSPTESNQVSVSCMRFPSAAGEYREYGQRRSGIGRQALSN